MAYDGIQYGNRVDNTTERKLHAKVVDNVLSAATYGSRLMGMGEPFLGKTMDYAVKVTSDTQGEYVVGLETLNASAVNTTIALSYAQAAFTQPKVSVMLESFANVGQTGTIPLDAFKYEEAASESLANLGQTLYGTGTANQPNGLGIIVLDSGTIGGQSRSTYTVLNATNTASSGVLSLAKMATLDDNVSAASLTTEAPNIGNTDKATWSYYEQLLNPTVRNDYNGNGTPMVSVRGKFMERAADLGGKAGFRALSYRGMPIIKDDYCTAGVLFFLNERYFGWAGRAVVPDEYKTFLEKVNLGTQKVYEGTGAAALTLPSEFNGWFYQKSLMLPNQAGTIARFWVIGQTCAWQPRRSGKLTGITGI